MIKVEYMIAYYRQVLYSGTWEDGDWDWEDSYEHFKTREDAEAKFRKSVPTDDVPIIRLYKMVTDTETHEVEETLLDEIS